MRQWRDAVRFWYGTRRRPWSWRTRLRPDSTSKKKQSYQCLEKSIPH